MLLSYSVFFSTFKNIFGKSLFIPADNMQDNWQTIDKQKSIF